MQQQLSLLDIADKSPGVPGHKVGGASRNAAEAMKKRAPSLKAIALAELVAAYPAGCTPDECAAVAGCTELAMRPRLSELYAEGRALKTDETRTNTSGLPAHVYVWHKKPETPA